MVPFTPRLIPAILPSLAHHVPDIQTAAIKANQLLFNVIQGLPAAGALQGQVPNLPSKSMSVPASAARNLNPLPASTGIADNIIPSSSPPAPSPLMNRQTLDGIDPNTSKPRAIPSNLDQGGGSSSNSSVADKDGALVFASNQQQSRPGSPTQDPERKATLDANNIVEAEPFDYHATVSALTIRFLSEYEDTRVAALKWLIMLHQKLPNKVRHLS